MSKDDVTGLLRALSAGNRAVEDRLLTLVYDELRRVASLYMRRERGDHTLRPTALVHEAYLRLVDQRVEWQNRKHFFGVAAQVMRRVLVDHARSRRTAKRGGKWVRVSLDELGHREIHASPDVDVLALDQALEELQAIDPDRGRLVELRYFAGLSVEQTADVLGVSPSTVSRDWRLAKAWLFRRLQGATGT